MDNDYRKHPNSKRILDSYYIPRYRKGDNKTNMERWADLAQYRRAKSWYEGSQPRERSKIEIAGSLLDVLFSSGRFLVSALLLAGFLWLLFVFVL